MKHHLWCLRGVSGVMAAVLLFFLAHPGYCGQNDPGRAKLLEKIGQMFIVGFRGTEISEDSYIVKVLNEVQPGGVILFDYDVPSKSFPRNIVNPDQTRKLISDLQEYSSHPLFIAVDVEGGRVNRLKERYGFSSFPGAEELGKNDNLDETKQTAKQIGKNLAWLGFNVNFAPVVDVNVNPDNPVIGSLGRSFSFDPEKVFLHASAFIEGLHSCNIISTLKHFPGHGSSFHDSHLGMVDVTKSYQEKELVPYKKLIAGGFSDMVMTAHIVDRYIDPDFPATLSPLFISELLRGEIGFKGVVVSDDMHMGAIVQNYGFAEAIVRAVNAGVDLLIISNNGESYEEEAIYEAQRAIVEAVEDGVISPTRIDESYERIRELKARFFQPDFFVQECLHANTNQLIQFISAAVKEIEILGEQAFSQFREKNGRWFYDDTYIFVWGIDGMRYVYPPDVTGEGSNMCHLEDVDGRAIGKMFVEVATSPAGQGWVHYRWPKPGEDEPIWKATFIKRAVSSPSGTNYLVGSGYYVDS
ncbi:cache domain-containing protein [Candidatus Aerophobetes bacterium]|nr:cache domain-containing protein [Candidatus Aerophobetes bacterium]